MDNDHLLYCSFCGKSNKEVFTLIAGPAVFICDECVSLCAEILIDLYEKNKTNAEPLTLEQDVIITTEGE